MSSTNSKPNQMLYAILKSQGKHNFIDLIKEHFNKSALINPSKPFTVLIPSDSAINRLSLEPKSKIKYVIKSHILQGNHDAFKGRDTKHRTHTGNFDVVFAHHSGGKIIMKDSNGNEFSVTQVPKNKYPKSKENNFNIYRITSGCIDPKIKKNAAKKSSKRFAGGINNGDKLNTMRLKIHQNILGKFKAYLCDTENCINPYAPAVAGLLKSLELRGHEEECKKAALLMTNCSFALFYILVQPFKTRGDHLISDDAIQEWAGKDFYPEDICKFFCDFAQKHASEIYKNSQLLEQINTIRSTFKLNENYKEWLMNNYQSFEYPGHNIISPQEKYYFDEIKFKLCNIYCTLMRNSGDFEDVLLYNMQMIELLFPCNDELAESKFLDPSYKELLSREDLIAPGSIYKFVFSTDFMSLPFSKETVKSFDIIKSNPSEIGPNSSSVFDSEAYRCNMLTSEVGKIKSIYEYNKKLYC